MFDSKINKRQFSPCVSLGLVSYNEESHISATILSLLGQTFTDFELIICDNGSTDNTLTIIEKFMTLDSRIKLFTEPFNKGALFNFEKARGLARCKYFSWVAGHDIYDVKWLEEMVLALSSDDSLCFVASKTFGFDDSIKKCENVGKNFDSSNVSVTERLSKPFDMVLAGSRIYGLQNLTKTKNVPLLKTPYWDRLYLSLVNCLGGSKHVENALLYRRYNGDLKSKMPDIDLFSRQLRMLYMEGRCGFLNVFPSIKNRALLFAWTLILAEGVIFHRRLVLAWKLAMRYRIGITFFEQCKVFKLKYLNKK